MPNSTTMSSDAAGGFTAVGTEQTVGGTRPLTEFKDAVKAFVTATRTGQIDRAAELQLRALEVIAAAPKSNWAGQFKSAYARSTFPLKEFFGGHGAAVTALYFTDERLDLIVQAQAHLPPEQSGIDPEDVRGRAEVVERARALMRVELPLTTSALGKRLTAEGFGRSRWFLTWMERNREIRTDDETVTWIQTGGVITVERRVPPFQEYYAKYSDMNPEQRNFYNEVFRPQFLAGEAVDVEGNLSYVFVLLHDMLRKRRKFAEVLPRSLAMAEKIGKGQTLAHYANAWLADFDFLESRWEAGFNTRERLGLGLDEVLARTLVLPDRRITVDEVSSLMLGRKRMGAVGRQRQEDVESMVQAQLDFYHDENGVSLLGGLWRRLEAYVEGGDPLQWDPEEGEPFITVEAVKAKLAGTNRMRKRPDDPEMTAWFGVPGARVERIPWPIPLPEPQGGRAFQVIADRLRAEFRRAENAVRDELGVARVGEGWVSEVNLLHRVREAFPDILVRHQGRPGWLGRQSVDIYLPEYNIAIEYQGAQHSRPVEIFGGEATFAEQQERDERKRSLCAEHDCVLIEVFPDYEFAEVEQAIQLAIDSRPAWYLGRADR